MLLSRLLQFVVSAPGGETDAAWEVHCRNCVSDLLTASPSAGEQHKPHLFLFLRLQEQTT